MAIPKKRFFRIWGRRWRRPALLLFNSSSSSSSSSSVPKPTFRIELQDDGFVFSSLPPFDPTNSFCHSVHGLLRVNVFFFFFIWICCQPASHLSINNSNNNNNSQQQKPKVEKGERKIPIETWAYRTTLISSGRTTRLNINRARRPI